MPSITEQKHLLTVEQKRFLGELLAKGHRRFGKVKWRRPYREDDEGGTGSAELLFETHPLLAQIPPGASSDLTAIISDNQESLDEAVNRENDLGEELKKNPVLAAALANQRGMMPPSPTPISTR